MKMELLWWAMAVIAGYIVFVGIFFTNKIMYIEKKTDEEIYHREVSEGRFRQEEFEALPKEEFALQSPFGYQIKGICVQQNHSPKWMIFCHGVTMNKTNSIKYMNLFLKRGWNTLIYDHRRHGDSGGKTTSYGYYEKYDLQAVVHWLKNQFDTPIVLGIHGESMGAATMLLYAGCLEDGANFYIADCPFSDFEEQLRYRLKVEYRLPAFLVLPIANLFLKIRDGYFFSDVSPIRAVERIQHPILFIHSAKDDFILPDMTKKLYEKKKGAKMLLIAPKGLHAYSYADNPTEYEQAIDDFLAKFQLS
jgi:uncharacterized protein